MFGVILLAVMVEGISKLRFIAQRNLRSTHHKYKRSLITALHGLQALVGYILMLATMTFSVELLICVIFGLGVGYGVFYEDGDNHVTTNPCCNFIQGEADERELNFVCKPRQEPSISTTNAEERSEDLNEQIDAAVPADEEPEIAV